MKQTIAAAVVSVAMFASPSTWAREITVEITNITNAVYFTPLLAVAHDRTTHLFEVGHEASDALQAMAEGGDISGLIAAGASAGAEQVADPAGGLLVPGQSTSFTMEAPRKGTTHLSIVAMMLPTNDGFVGLDAVRIPKRQGRYLLYLNGYDAGTEANDEIVNGGGAPGVPGIPADPGDNGGSGASGVAGPDRNPSVHVHRGVAGDTQADGGPSDLDSRVHRWLNPVARVVLTVAGRDRHGDRD